MSAHSRDEAPALRDAVARRPAADVAILHAALGRSQAVGEIAPDGTVLRANVNLLRLFGDAEHDSVLLAIVVQRGRSIPVLCLSRLTGLEPPPRGATSRVLVVRSPTGPVGFALRSLREIGRSAGERQWPGVAAGDPASRALPVVDLRLLAGTLPAVHG